MKNIDISIFEINGAAFRILILQSPNIHFWWTALFFFDSIELVLSATSTLGLMSPKYILALIWQIV